MEPANWARTYPRLRRNIRELVELGCEVTTPPHFDRPPSRRHRTGGPVGRGQAVIVGESSPEWLGPLPPSKDHHPLL